MQVRRPKPVRILKENLYRCVREWLGIQGARGARMAALDAVRKNAARLLACALFVAGLVYLGSSGVVTKQGLQAAVENNKKYLQQQAGAQGKLRRSVAPRLRVGAPVTCPGSYRGRKLSPRAARLRPDCPAARAHPQPTGAGMALFVIADIMLIAACLPLSFAMELAAGYFGPQRARGVEWGSEDSGGRELSLCTFVRVPALDVSLDQCTLSRHSCI